MSRRAAPPSNFRTRITAAAVVVGGHVAALTVLSWQEARETASSADERMTLVFVDLPRAPVVATPPAASRATQRARAIPTAPAPSLAPPPGESAAIDPSAGNDWYAQGAAAAQRAAAEPTTRRFDFPKREPPPREKPAFGWDKTHTERVHALEGGGIGIHLSDNCDLLLAPLPLAGCAFGKRKARGDLFDGMKAPPEMGDWKDR
jgi:hypothetical protein